MKHGRPLRFLSLVVVGWTAMRVAVLWPTVDTPSSLIRALAPPALASTAALPDVRAIDVVTAPGWREISVPGINNRKPVDPITISLALAALVSFGSSIPTEEAPADQIADRSVPPPLAPTPIVKEAGRLSGSAWLIARDGSGRPALGGSQLGGSQAGARLAYAIDGARRFAIVGRIATPLSGRGREGALGVEWHVGNAVRLVAEQRFAFDRGGRGGPALGIVAGIGPKDVGAGFRLEAYGQAGVIARDGAEGYGDGAVRGYRPLARIGASAIDFGAGAWGGAQRGASRLDIGPSIGLAVPVGARRLRMNLDWRERIAGSARPTSGPALSLGTDF